MSAAALDLSGDSAPSGTGNPSLEVVKLSPGWEEGLRLFLQTLSENGDTSVFSPHPTDEATINRLAHHMGMDLYYLLVEGENVLGYGLLRGWDEGYQIPSLGIAIHPSVRGQGLGEVLIGFMHILASRRGANTVRLRVHRNNNKAIALYRKLGYVFQIDSKQTEYFIGFVKL
jgi:[ribosomal protein S18]-alanine N-acetyltransferase